MACTCTPETGKVYTLEIEPEYAKIAKNIQNAGCTSKVDVIVGKALETLPTLKEKGTFLT